MAEQTETASHFEPLSALWRIFAAPLTLLILMGLLALTLAAGTVIPQIPEAFAGDPQAWLAMQPGVWGQASSILHVLGVFDLHSSIWFRALLVLVGLCLFVRTVDSVELAWRVARRETWTPDRLAAWGAQPPRIEFSLPFPLDETLERVSALMSERGFWSSMVPTLAVPSLVAVRRGAMLWTRPLAYALLLAALVSMAIAGVWGWEGESWQPREGDEHAVGHGTQLSVRLDAFTIAQGEGGTAPEHSSRVTWLQGETVLEQDTVGAGRTSDHAGISLRQEGYVPAVRLRGWDAGGRPLMLETEGDVLGMTGEADIRFNSPKDRPLILIPGQDLFLMLSFEPGCEGEAPALHISRIHAGGNEREVLGTFPASGTVSVDDLQLEVDLAFVPILRLDRQPALGLVLVCLALFILVLIANWIAPPHLLWIAMAQENEQSSLVRFLALPGAGEQPWLSELAGLVQEELHDDA